jgi:type II secretory pathway pseudopilin PulG
MCKNNSVINNERGFVLIASLLILLILLVIGVAATTTSTIDMQIATNEKFHQQTFYQADGGAELASRITYENALCSSNFGGFTQNPAGSGTAVIGNAGRVVVSDLNFADPAPGAVPLPSDAVRDVVYYPDNISDNDIHTNMTAGGFIDYGPGGGIGVGGYEGGGSAHDSAIVQYTINAQHRGMGNSESIVGLEWEMGLKLMDDAAPSDCNY